MLQLERSGRRRHTSLTWSSWVLRPLPPCARPVLPRPRDLVAGILWFWRLNDADSCSASPCWRSGSLLSCLMDWFILSPIPTSRDIYVSGKYTWWTYEYKQGCKKVLVLFSSGITNVIYPVIAYHYLNRAGFSPSIYPNVYLSQTIYIWVIYGQLPVWSILFMK